MMMRQHPGGPLAEIVDCIWYSDRGVADHPRERSLPTGAMTLVVRLGGDPIRIFRDKVDREGRQFAESVVWGPQSKYVVTDTARIGTTVGVQFHPGAAGVFFREGTGDLRDRHVPLEDLWGPHARAFRERLMGAGSPAGALSLLEQLLARRLTRPLLLHPAVAYSLRELTARPSAARIGEIGRATGYSPKRFIQLFTQAVGLTPKLYSRIQRFQALIRIAASGGSAEWADAAADNGYYDQPHLNRDFRCFSGMSPGSYRPVSQDRPNHVVIEP